MKSYSEAAFDRHQIQHLEGNYPHWRAGIYVFGRRHPPSCACLQNLVGPAIILSARFCNPSWPVLDKNVSTQTHRCQSLISSKPAIFSAVKPVTDVGTEALVTTTELNSCFPLSLLLVTTCEVHGKVVFQLSTAIRCSHDVHHAMPETNCGMIAKVVSADLGSGTLMLLADIAAKKLVACFLRSFSLSSLNL